MGPTIILDKSTLQSLPQRAIYELSAYFYTNITPVLLMEILADLRLEGEDIDDCRDVVAKIARKVFPVDAITNVPFQTLCLADLLGGKIVMDGRPIAGNAQHVTCGDGSSGVLVGVQSEKEAVLRWQSGEFSEADLMFAVNWRKAVKAANLEQVKRTLPKLTVTVKSLSELRAFVDTILNDAESQPALLELLMQLLEMKRYIRDWVRSRWRNNDHVSIKAFAPYAHHFLRVNLLFCFGVSSSLLGTRNSNIVDMQYLYYVPFCKVFSTGDKFLRQMASLVLGEDQSFVWHDDLREALDELAIRRQATRGAASVSPAQQHSVERDENSLIQTLWQKHWGRFMPQIDREPISKEQSERLMKQLKPLIEAMDKASRQRPHQRRFPV